MSSFPSAGRVPPARILLCFLRLGLTSFGGPIAHLGYFREEFVARRAWLSDQDFADVVAIAQTLPGPASSQTGFAVGLLKGGWLGGLAAWVGFTTPSALLMFAFAYAQGSLNGRVAHGVVHGLQLVAVAVVAQAVLNMQRTLAPDRLRASVAVLGAISVLVVPTPFNTVAAILVGAASGFLLPKLEVKPGGVPAESLYNRRSGAIAIALFLALSIVASSLPVWWHAKWAGLFGAFYRSGALVFGGGHVVLPLLQSSVVANGWVGEPVFLAGYGAAQAIPGPLFTVAAFLGAVVDGPGGAIISVLAIFLPGLLLMAGILPFWRTVTGSSAVRKLLTGINAAVVGILAAALYTPIWITTVHGAPDFVVALSAFVLLVSWKIAPWKVVLLTAAASAVFA
jgi:chromate transporter